MNKFEGTYRLPLWIKVLIFIFGWLRKFLDMFSFIYESTKGCLSKTNRGVTIYVRWDYYLVELKAKNYP